jgi:hypothetical protein
MSQRKAIELRGDNGQALESQSVPAPELEQLVPVGITISIQDM